jgi:anti-sigma factor RsiW
VDAGDGRVTRWRCRRYQSWLVDRADGVLEASQRQQLERHLIGCSACQADLAALRHVSAALSASTVPDPGKAFWLQQRQAIGRTIRNLPEPRRSWSLEWLRHALQFSPWRYPIAAAAALLVALTVYRIAARPPRSGNDSISHQLAQLDADVLVALADLAQAVTPSDDSLTYSPHDDEVAFAALAAGDLVGTHPLAHVPDEAEMSDAELERMDDLLGGGSISDEV